MDVVFWRGKKLDLHLPLSSSLPRFSETLTQNSMENFVAGTNYLIEVPNAPNTERCIRASRPTLAAALGKKTLVALSRFGVSPGRKLTAIALT